MEQEVHAFMNHFESALHHIVNCPNDLVCDVKLVNDEEMRQIIPTHTADPAFNIDTDCLDSRSFVKNMSELIELQVDRTPQKIGVSQVIVLRLVTVIVFIAPIRSRCVLNL